MRVNIRPHVSSVGSLVVVAGLLHGLGACSTTEVAPPLPANPPEYLGVAHPVGFDLGDLQAVFFDKGAPALETLKDCDKPYLRLKELARNDEELRNGSYEIVKHDPVKMHWCFYGKLLNLENELKGDKYVDEKQDATLQTFAFLTPMARAFAHEFNDTRYMRWAIRRYKHISQWFFYRKLELTPKATSELVDAAQPFGLWRAVNEKKPLVDKYKLFEEPTAANAPPTAPASMAAAESTVSATAVQPTPAPTTFSASEPAAPVASEAPAGIAAGELPPPTSTPDALSRVPASEPTIR